MTVPTQTSIPAPRTTITIAREIERNRSEFTEHRRPEVALRERWGSSGGTCPKKKKRKTCRLATNKKVHTLGSGKHLHHGPTEEADADHHEPRWDKIESVDKGTEDNVEAILGKPAVHWMKRAAVLGSFLPQFFGVELVDVFSSHRGYVQTLGVDRGFRLRLAGLWLCGKLEVPERRRTG